MEPNTIEIQGEQEQVMKFNSGDFANKFLTLDEARKDAIKKAIEDINTEDGKNNPHSTFEGLFSAQFLEMINPETASDEENRAWRESQIKHLSILRQELLNAEGEESVNAAAKDLADHIINL